MAREQLKIFLVMVCITLFTISCKKKDEKKECYDAGNPDCVNYDPCLDQMPTSADFTISGQLGTGIHMNTFIEDEVFVGRDLKFSAVDKNASSYIWYLGVDTIENETELIRGIHNLPNGTYFAALVVEKEPNLYCFPMDTGRDSIYKEFTKIHWCDLIFNGSYRGSWDNAPNDTAEVSLVFSDPFFQEGPCGGYTLFGINLSGEHDTVDVYTQGYVNDHVIFGGDSFASPQGFATINKETMEVYMEYRYLNQDYTFRGKKI